MKGEVCNIGPKSIQTRWKIGVLLLIMAGLLSGFLIAIKAPFYERFIVFPFFMGGFISLLEAKTKVCVYYVWKKTQHME